LLESHASAVDEGASLTLAPSPINEASSSATAHEPEEEVIVGVDGLPESVTG